MISIFLLKTFRQTKYPIMLGGLINTVSLGLVSHAMDINNTGQINGYAVCIILFVQTQH